MDYFLCGTEVGMELGYIGRRILKIIKTTNYINLACLENVVSSSNNQPVHPQLRGKIRLSSHSSCGWQHCSN